MSAYSTAVLALSPVGYWRMSSIGSSETDLGSGGHALTYGAGAISKGQPGCVPADPTSASAIFNGTSGSNALDSNTTIIGATGTYGIVAWIRNSNASQNGPVCEYNGFGIWQWDASGGLPGPYINVNFAGTGVFSTQTAVAMPADGLNHQIAAIYNNGSISVFIDGTSVFAVSISESQNTNAANNVGGRTSPSAYFWAGAVGDVALIPNLTAAQVQNLHAIGTATTQTSYEMTALTSSGNFTTAADSSVSTVYRYRMVGGGGGGGGTSSVASGHNAVGGHGGAGAYAEGTLQAFQRVRR